MAKVFNLLIGILFVVLGIVGLLFPEQVGEYYGWAFTDVQGKTELRVLAGSFIGVGYLIGHFAVALADQRPVLFSIAVLNLSYIVPRFLGLWLDGGSQPLIFQELIFEVLLLIVVAALYFCEAKKSE